MKTSDFKCADLKNGNTSLFLVCPVTDLQTKMSGFVRMLTMMTMEVFQKTGERTKEPCLMVLDEMPSIGKIEILATGAAVFRKYGIRLVTVSQTISNLKTTYPKEWSDFLANSEACIWMANGHQETLEHLSSLLGTTTRKEKLKPSLWRRYRKIEKTQTQRVERPLMYPHQLAIYLDRNMIVTRSGKRPLRLKRGDYFTELSVSQYSSDPHYGETAGRKLWRNTRPSLLPYLEPVKRLINYPKTTFEAIAGMIGGSLD